MPIPDKTEVADMANATAFPAGLKVLIVDNQRACLRVLSRMLAVCGYEVTECEQHKKALELLRELKFDLVMSNVLNVSETDMDGFKLLEIAGLEMDLPVIMVSDNSRRETIMKAMKHGACDYIIKPVQKKEVEIIWKHVVRRKNNIVMDPESSGSLEKNSNEPLARRSDDASGDALRIGKKRREPTGEDDGELENGEESKKKERFNWNGERHEQFVAAVNQLGVNHAVPKKILNVLNIPGLKREHVASHLQKYRLGLKKAEKEKRGQQAHHFNSPFGLGLNPLMGSTSTFSFQTFPSRTVTWNNHASNIATPLCTLPLTESSTNTPGFLADSPDSLWQVVAPQQLPVRQTSMNPLLINQNYSLRNMQYGSNDGTTLSNNFMGMGSGTSQPPSLASTNKGFNSNNYNGLSGTGFVQNNYQPTLLGMDRIESPSCNSEGMLNAKSWDLDSQM